MFCFLLAPFCYLYCRLNWLSVFFNVWMFHVYLWTTSRWSSFRIISFLSKAVFFSLPTVYFRYFSHTFFFLKVLAFFNLYSESVSDDYYSFLLNLYFLQVLFFKTTTILPVYLFLKFCFAYYVVVFSSDIRHVQTIVLSF